MRPGLKKDLLVILNDNKMGICPRVRELPAIWTRRELRRLQRTDARRFMAAEQVPLVGESTEKVLSSF